MQAGSATLLAQVVAVFGAKQPYHAHCFANRRAEWLKVLVHYGIGIWMATRRAYIKPVSSGRVREEPRRS
jgi:hypothetical protein